MSLKKRKSTEQSSDKNPSDTVESETNPDSPSNYLIRCANFDNDDVIHTKTNKRKKTQKVSSNQSCKKTKYESPQTSQTQKVDHTVPASVPRSRTNKKSKNTEEQNAQREDLLRKQWQEVMQRIQLVPSDIAWSTFCDQHNYHTRLVLVSSAIDALHTQSSNFTSDVWKSWCLGYRGTLVDKQQTNSVDSTGNQMDVPASQVTIDDIDHVQDALEAVLADVWVVNGTNTCRACGSTKLAPIEHQGRSADEASDTLWKCLNCRERWKE